MGCRSVFPGLSRHDFWLPHVLPGAQGGSEALNPHGSPGERLTKVMRLRSLSHPPCPKSFEQSPGCLQGVDFRHRLVGSNANDARETHCQATVVPLALLEPVEGYFKNGIRRHLEIP